MSLYSASDLSSPAPAFVPRCPLHAEQPSTRSCPRCGALGCERCGGYCERCEAREALAIAVRRRAERARRFLWTCGVMAAGYGLLEGRNALWPNAQRGSLLAAGYMAIYAAVMLCTAVAFLRWLHGAMRLAPQVGAPESERSYSPRASVLWWFVPLAHYVVPYRIVRELYGRLGLQETEAEQRWTQTHFHLWWALWILSLSISRVATKLELSDKPAAAATGALAELFYAPAAFLAAALVGKIQARTEARLLGFKAL